MPRKIKVPVRLVIEVDPDAYNAEYGNEDPDVQIRLDLQSTALDAVRIALAHLPLEVKEA